MKRYLAFGAITVALLCSTGLRAEIIEQVLVKVNGEIITKSDLEQRQISARRPVDHNSATMTPPNARYRFI